MKKLKAKYRRKRYISEHIALLSFEDSNNPLCGQISPHLGFPPVRSLPFWDYLELPVFEVDGQTEMVPGMKVLHLATHANPVVIALSPLDKYSHMTFFACLRLIWRSIYCIGGMQSLRRKSLVIHYCSQLKRLISFKKESGVI